MAFPALTTAPARSLPRRALRLASLVTTPLLPQDYLELLMPLRAGSGLRGRVVAVRAETADAATLVIRPGRGWAGHRAGQYVRVGVEVDGVRHWRTYSVTSATGHGDIAITVKHVPGGLVSTELVRATRPGRLLALEQAAGDFTLPARPPSAALFLTAGSGITPVMGMLRTHLDELEDAVVVHSAPSPDEAVFGPELRELAAAGRIRLVERHTRTAGRLDLGELDTLVPDWAGREAWACGPGALLDAAEAHWAAAGLAARLRTERFRLASLAVGEGGPVTFSRSATEVEAQGSATLLDTGEAAGVLMPSGCRMGICFGCVVPLTDGAVRDVRNGELTTATPESPVPIQTCVSAAAGPCAIDL